MQKIIRKSGNSLFIRIDKEDAELYDLDEGDFIDLEICKIQKNEALNGRV